MQILIPLWFWFLLAVILSHICSSQHVSMVIWTHELFNIDTIQLKYIHWHSFWRSGIGTTANTSLLISSAVSVYSVASIVPNRCDQTAYGANGQGFSDVRALLEIPTIPRAYGLNSPADIHVRNWHQTNKCDVCLLFTVPFKHCCWYEFADS